MELTYKITGFVACFVFTILAYFIILYPEWFLLENKTATIMIFMLALAQSIVQLLCFINVWKEKGPLWNLHVFLSTISVIFIVIWFSIWVMDHLNHNMMPH